jgi:hypothetical protein
VITGLYVWELMIKILTPAISLSWNLAHV